MADEPKYRRTPADKIEENIKPHVSVLNFSDRDEPRTNGEDTLGNKYFFDGIILDYFINNHGEKFRYVSSWGRWLIWDGRRWKVETTQLVKDLLAGIAARLTAEEKHRLSASRIGALEQLAQVRRNVAREADIWDSNQLLLNTQTCTVNLGTDQRYPHQRDDNLTKLAGAGVGDSGDCPRWKQFLKDVTAGDTELQAYLQRVAGYCLTGSTREEVFFFAYGTGGNGKTTFVETLAAVLGSYARNVPAETFMDSKHERHPTELAAMQGYRLIIAAEVKRGARWHETRVKEVTGGDTVSARYMRQDFFEYRPQFKLVISGNHKPRLRSVDEAMRRRLHLLPFIVTIAKGTRDLGLKAKLLEERDQILQWALEGCHDWQREGLNPPSVVLSATNAYFEDMNVLGRWLDEHCEIDKRFHATAAALFADWKSWCENNGEAPGFQRAFADALDEQGFEARKIAGARSYFGLRLIASPPPN
jgi:putative DNA primase/helicase